MAPAAIGPLASGGRFVPTHRVDTAKYNCTKPGRRGPVRGFVRCEGGGGFGANAKSKHKKTAEEQEEATFRKDAKQARRRSSKGKKTFRERFVQLDARPEGLPEERWREKELLEQAMAAQELKAEEEAFNEKLAALRQEGKAALAQNQPTSTPSIYKEPAVKQPAPSQYSKREPQDSGSVDSGPGQAVLLGLSIILVIVFVLTSSGSGLPFLSSARRRRAAMMQQAERMMREADDEQSSGNQNVSSGAAGAAKVD